MICYVLVSMIEFGPRWLLYRRRQRAFTADVLLDVDDPLNHVASDSVDADAAVILARGVVRIGVPSHFGVLDRRNKLVPERPKDPDNEQASAFIKRVQKLLKADGHGKLELDMEKLLAIVNEDPESAAALVSAVSRAPEVPAMIGQLAQTIAVAYELQFGDDSLKYEIEKAPWRGNFGDPLLKDMGETKVDFDPLEVLCEGAPDLLRVLEIDADSLDEVNIGGLMRALSVTHPPVDLARARRQATLWGQCLLVFTALDNDPRQVYFVPKARRYMTALHEAMPYLPVYLNFRPESGSFILYFGALADTEALSDDGTSVNIFHPSVFERLSESLVAIGNLSRDLGRDPKPIWRAILSVYPVGTVDGLMEELEASLNP